MKLLVCLLVTGCWLAVARGNEKKLLCQIAPANVPREWITMTSPCVKKMRDQVQVELEAALTYLAMGAHFHRDTVNRPGFGNLFLEAASEEREHASRIIDYLLLRGELTQDVRELVRKPTPTKTEWPDAITALRDALRMEAAVTENLKAIIATCEHPPKNGGERPANDYHLVDYLSGEFLEEQYRGQRKLAGYVSDLGKMADVHGVLGEFLFDKRLLEGPPAA